jgi:hypothetical protein
MLFEWCNNVLITIVPVERWVVNALTARITYELQLAHIGLSITIAL